MYQRMMLDIIKSYVEAVTCVKNSGVPRDDNRHKKSYVEAVRYVENSDVPRDDTRLKKSYVEVVENVCDDVNIRSPDRKISSSVNMTE